MVGQTLDQRLMALIGLHARTVRRESTFPTGALIPQVRVWSVCCGPVEPKYSRCYPCNERTKQFGDELADIVVPLSYTVRDHQDLQQFYLDLHQYKSRRPSIVAQQRLKALLYLFRLHHQKCLENKIGQPVNSVIAVPSGRNRASHPLPTIAKLLSHPVSGLSEPELLTAKFVGSPRQDRVQGTNPSDFAINGSLSGHVVIVEDTWVQGHNAQGLAIQARQSGADKVSIVVLARMLAYTYPLTKTMVDCWGKTEHFDPAICPVTGQQQQL